MRAMSSDSRVSMGLGAALAVAVTVAPAQVPQPPINGVVVEDVTRPYSFDQIGEDFESGPFINKDAYQGTVRSMVIRAPDNTFDFHFHITTSSGLLKNFSFEWQTPASYTVAYHVTDPVLLWSGEGPSSPPPGSSESSVRGAGAFWCQEENCGGALFEGVLVLDTDAKAYAATASYQLSDSFGRLQGNYSGQSPEFTTFGPAIPEPETYALMLAGLGLLALGRRVRQRY
jgi:hypothetical protein